MIKGNYKIVLSAIGIFVVGVLITSGLKAKNNDDLTCKHLAQVCANACEQSQTQDGKGNCLQNCGHRIIQCYLGKDIPIADPTGSLPRLRLLLTGGVKQSCKGQ